MVLLRRGIICTTLSIIMKVIHNRDVVFNEDSTLGIQKESLCKYVELKVDDKPNIKHTIAQNSIDTETHDSAEPRQLSEENSAVVMCDMKYFIYCLSRLSHTKYVTIR